MEQKFQAGVKYGLRTAHPEMNHRLIIESLIRADAMFALVGVDKRTAR